MQLTLNGHNAFVAQYGAQTAPALVLIHGAGGDHSVWGWQARGWAAAGRRVLVPDLPGHGQSAGPALTSIQAVSDWVAALLDALGLAQAAIAGHSMGGLVALDFADRWAGRCRGALLLGAAARMPVHPDLLTAARDDAPRAVAMILKWAFAPGDAARRVSLGHSVERAVREVLERCSAASLHADFAACDAYRDGLAAAARLTVPATLIIGAQDRMVALKHAQALAAAIPGAELAVIPDCGHMLMQEAPAAVWRAAAMALGGD